MQNHIKKSITILKKGGVIAYPTEAVYGLGCDPFNKSAVFKILKLKKRSVDKGLIVVASSWNQIQDLIQPLTNEQKERVNSTWPGPVTWIFPATKTAPPWIIGKHKSIAIRISAHQTIKDLCNAFSGPIVSTSANIDGQPPAKNIHDVTKYFGEKIDLMIDGKTDKTQNPSEIRDLLTDKVLRA